MQLDNSIPIPFFLDADGETDFQEHASSSINGAQPRPDMSIREAAVDLTTIDCNAILQEWTWIVRGQNDPLLMTAFGDLFLQNRAGQIWFLDLVSGEYNFVASSAEEWATRFKEPKMVKEWLMPHLIQTLLDHQITLAPGTCYGYKVPPIIGGKLEVSNIEPIDIPAYYALTSQIHQQARDLPPGTPFSEISVEGFKP